MSHEPLEDIPDINLKNTISGRPEQLRGHCRAPGLAVHDVAWLLGDIMNLETTVVVTTDTCCCHSVGRD